MSKVNDLWVICSLMGIIFFLVLLIYTVLILLHLVNKEFALF